MPPQYTYTADRAASLAQIQVARLQADLQPVDDAFISSKTPEVRRTALQAVLPWLSLDNRSILQTLEPSRWPTVEQAAAVSLLAGEKTEI